MANRNEAQNIKDFVAEAARKKKNIDKKNSELHKDDVLRNAVRRKDEHIASAAKKSIFANPVISRALRISAIATLILLNITWVYFLSRSLIGSEDIECSGFAKLSDFKDAKKFAEKVLNGSIPDKKLFVADSSESMRRDSLLMLERLKGATVSNVVLDDCENVVFKATCRSNTETAVIYIAPSDNRFHISAIEIQNNNKN